MTLSNIIHRDKSLNTPKHNKHRIGHSLLSIQENMDHILHDFFDGYHFFPLWEKDNKIPAIDIIDKNDNYQVNVDLAGVNPDNIDILISDSSLTIKGEKEEEFKNKEGSYLYQETQYGSFERTISIPKYTDSDKAEAIFKNGVLKVILPKKVQELKKLKKIKIQKAA